jgi:hypothetical protein
MKSYVTPRSRKGLLCDFASLASWKSFNLFNPGSDKRQCGSAPRTHFECLSVTPFTVFRARDFYGNIKKKSNFFQKDYFF